VLVIINNAIENRTLHVQVDGLQLQGSVRGERSTEDERWKSISSFQPTSPQRVTFSVPEMSVTTIRVPLDTSG